ncbi:MAG: ABC transporter substrate-binding protein [Microbacteriaceae bacterium]
MKHKVLTTAVVLATAFAMAACSSTPTTTDSTAKAQEKGPITIGMVVPLTGPYAPLGTGDKAAAEQEVATINAAGGIDGRKVTLIVKDDKTDVTQSVTEYNQLAADKSVSAILSSSFASASAATAPSAVTNKIPTLALSPISVLANGSNKYAFTVPATPEVYAQALVDYFVKTGVKSIAIGYASGDVYGQTGNDATKAAADKAGLKVALDEGYDQTATDFSALITHVQNSKADGLLVWGAGPAPVIITKQMRAKAPDVGLYMTGAQASSLYVKPSGDAAEGVIMGSSIAVAGDQLPDGPLKKQIDAFVTPWKSANDGVYPPQFAFDGLTGISLIKAAIQKAKSSDRDAIRDALESLDVLMPAGHYKYSSTNHAGLTTDAVAIVEVKGGQFVATDYALGKFKTNLPK